jgi:dipeptidyl-peptidase 9
MGEWEVIGRKIWYDKKNNLVYFLGLAHSPLEKHLYVFNLFNPDHKRMLTVPGASNVVEFNEVGIFLPLFVVQI